MTAADDPTEGMEGDDHTSSRWAGRVTGPADREVPPEVLERAVAIECPDCNVNVGVIYDEAQPGFWRFEIAHDATCPWLASQEQGATS